MEFWFSEEHTKNVRFSLRVSEQLFSAFNKSQRVDIFNSIEFGKVLTLDGRIMITERDEFIYHEMITHVPLCVNPGIKRVLLINGGDGGTVRELVKYNTIEKIDLIDVDDTIITACKKFIPKTSACLNDSRVEIFFTDESKFIRRKKNEYDLIIIDATDSNDSNEKLFAKEFYGTCYNALSEKGILINQHENPFYSRDITAMQKSYKKISHSFPISYVYQINIPTYPAGQWLFGFASKSLHPMIGVNFENWSSRKIITKYYNTKIHVASFALPNYVLNALKFLE